MKFVTYLYVNKDGDVAEATKKPINRNSGRTVCLKVSADIPDEYFETPMFGLEAVVPPPRRKGSGTVQDWLSKDAQVLEEVEQDEEEQPRKYIYEDDDVPF